MPMVPMMPVALHHQRVNDTMFGGISPCLKMATVSSVMSMRRKYISLNSILLLDTRPFEGSPVIASTKDGGHSRLPPPLYQRGVLIRALKHDGFSTILLLSALPSDPRDTHSLACFTCVTLSLGNNLGSCCGGCRPASKSIVAPGISSAHPDAGGRHPPAPRSVCQPRFGLIPRCGNTPPLPGGAITGRSLRNGPPWKPREECGEAPPRGVQGLTPGAYAIPYHCCRCCDGWGSVAIVGAGMMSGVVAGGWAAGRRRSR
mmetsp:Transcript_41775/g.75031  ORF Transcript_41775/g.75031 Transcript_41775/m.75031 type:complete len:259 (+) Transcript_41775:1534-2310(+)